MKSKAPIFFLIPVLILFVINPNIFAQVVKTNAERVDYAVVKWNDYVKLDNNQKQAVKVLITSFICQYDSINALDSLSFFQRQDLKKEAHSIYIKKVKALMSGSQLQEYERKQAAFRAADEAKKNNKTKK